LWNTNARAQDFFYTVQLLSNKTEVKNLEALPNSPEIFFTKQNGMVLHNAGKHQKFSTAMKAMQDIKSKTSYKDAFVSAYFKGKKVPFHEAKKIENELLEKAKTQLEPKIDTALQKEKEDSSTEEEVKAADAAQLEAERLKKLEDEKKAEAARLEQEKENKVLAEEMALAKK